MEQTVKKKQKKVYKNPQLPLLEEIGNAVTHGLGVIFTIVVMILMYIKADTLTEYLAVSIYSFGLFILYIMSTLYHSFKAGTKVKAVFRRFDHCSIYFLIGGTFAPILLCLIGGKTGINFFIIQWIIIFIGVTIKAIFHPSRLLPLHVTFYLLLGWSGLLFIKDLYVINHNLFYLILSGGIVYSLGVIPFGLKFKGAHFIWHFFVLGGTILQFIGIYLYII